MTAQPAPAPQRLHAHVRGIVQGVNFRYYTGERARQLGLTGWVRNLRDGSVEVLAEGPRPALDQLLDFLRRGPPAARVEEVRADWSAASGDFAGFEMRW
ncbi:MAG: acylphosphatase [Anaerolineales bacterium]